MLWFDEFGIVATERTMRRVLRERRWSRKVIRQWRNNEVDMYLRITIVSNSYSLMNSFVIKDQWILYYTTKVLQQGVEASRYLALRTPYALD